MPEPSHMASMPQPSQRLPCGVKKRQTRRRQIKAGLDRSSAPPHVHNHEERKPSHRHERTGSSGARRPRGTCGSCVVHIIERALIRERQREGIELAKKRGAYRGRKRSLSEEQVTELRQRAGAGAAKAMLAREFCISRETVYQYLRTTR